MRPWLSRKLGFSSAVEERGSLLRGAPLGHSRALCFLSQNGYTPLHIAAKKNQMQIASTLLRYGAGTDGVTKQGVTPLHLASQEGHTDMVTLLLDKGADIHMSTKVFCVCLSC